jgi:hypothetical protein
MNVRRFAVKPLLGMLLGMAVALIGDMSVRDVEAGVKCCWCGRNTPECLPEAACCGGAGQNPGCITTPCYALCISDGTESEAVCEPY